MFEIQLCLLLEPAILDRSTLHHNTPRVSVLGHHNPAIVAEQDAPAVTQHTVGRLPRGPVTIACDLVSFGHQAGTSAGAVDRGDSSASLWRLARKVYFSLSGSFKLLPSYVLADVNHVLYSS